MYHHGPEIAQRASNRKIFLGMISAPAKSRFLHSFQTERAPKLSSPRKKRRAPLYRAFSTVNFNPTALVTATRVATRGLPFGDSTRYKFSRSMPAILATLAIPPRASATRRSAIKKLPVSPLSSKAALRYSAANSRFSRKRRRMTSPCDSLLMSFLVLFMDIHAALGIFAVLPHILNVGASSAQHKPHPLDKLPLTSLQLALSECYC